MNAPSIVIPRLEIDVIDRNGKMDRNWYKFLALLAKSNGPSLTNSDDGQIAGINDDLEDTLSAQQIGFALYGQTGAERSAVVTPVNYGYAPGNVLRYGADPTGVADSTAAIQGAINVMQLAGGGLVTLPNGTYKIGTAGTGLVISASNVSLVGAGSSYISNAGTPSAAATTLTWGGGSSLTAAMVAVTSPQGASLSAIQGIQVSGMTLKCNSLCGNGLLLTSVKKSNFNQIYCIDPITAAYQLTTWLNANLVDTDTQHCIFTQCVYRCLGSVAAKKAHGFWGTNANTASASNGNTSFNTFIECLGQTDGTTAATSGIGIKLDAADNNSFINCICYRANGSTAPSVQLNGYNSSSDGNLFYHFSDTTPANAINILGNATLGSGYNPHQNAFIAVDSNNGVNYPTMDAGCRVTWSNTNGISQQPTLTGAVLAALGNDPNALAQAANVTTESVRVYNASSNHITLTDGTVTWALNFDGSGNLRINQTAGATLVKVVAALESSGTIAANFATAIPAGGNNTNGFLFSSTATFGIFFGSGVPGLSAAQGSLYLRSDGNSTSTRLYVNTNGSTGWTNVVTAT
jgi:hypothetical protein